MLGHATGAKKGADSKYIADALFPEAEPVFDNATALHAAVDMLDPEPARVEGLVGLLLLSCQRLSAEPVKFEA
jgi:hypothetical protein